MKNFYKILGISSDASVEEITAVYKALAKIYHPDIYKGNKKHSAEKMKEINEAYNNLSDKTKRKKHDEDLKSSHGNFKDEEGTFSDEENERNKERDFIKTLQEEWKFVCDYYPDLDKHYKEIKSINKKIAFIFQAIIIYEKKFDQAEVTKNQLINKFLERYFGTNKKIHKIVLFALKNNKKRVAKEFNIAIKLLGSKNSDRIIKRISEKEPKFFNDFNGIKKPSVKDDFKPSGNKTKIPFAVVLLLSIPGLVILIFILIAIGKFIDTLA